MTTNPGSPTHGALIWTDVLPEDFKSIRLSGCTLSSSSGAFGTICIQEFQSTNFSFRFNVFDIFQHFVLQNKREGSGFHSRILLKGQINQQLANKKWKLLPYQFSLLYADNPAIKETYERSLHISFDTSFSANWINDILRLFPASQKNTERKFFLLPHQWADMEIMELVQSILQCKYEKELRRHFWESRVRDLFFKMLMLSSAENTEEKEPSEKDMAAVNKAEHFISNDISVHINIPDLSKKVLLNEFDLKRFFKKIFGVGLYEYLVRLRMKKAKQMLEAGSSVKEVAAGTGYRPTDFIVAFRQFYGFTPGSMKKKNS